MINNFDFLVIFGATGDLVERKIIPSLYYLYHNKQINKDNFKIFAFARRDFTNGKYKEIVLSSLQKHFSRDDIKIDEDFYNLFNYVQGDLNNRDCFIELNTQILDLEDRLGVCANKLFYLAIPPSLYDEVINHIKNTQFNKMCKGAEVKVLLEKPFGLNKQTSITTNNIVSEVFNENQIFRLDHYLGKDIVRNITKAKDNLKELWNTNNIERVFISATETLGVEKRGEFFDSVGSLRDVGQNHLLELLALIAMEDKDDIGIESFRESRGSILSKLVKYSPPDIAKFTFRAQYKGYRDIEKVSPNSNTETYFKIAAFIDDPKWKYTKFIIEGGKRTGQSRSFIQIDFKNKDKLFINFNRENPFIRIFKGSNYRELFVTQKASEQYVLEYSTMIEEALKGDLRFFIDQNEVLAQWDFIDPIIDGWENNLVPLFTYMPDDISILSISKI